MMLEYHIHKCTSQSIMLCTSTLPDLLTEFILSEFYFCVLLASKTGVHAAFMALVDLCNT